MIQNKTQTYLAEKYQLSEELFKNDAFFEAVKEVDVFGTKDLKRISQNIDHFQKVGNDLLENVANQDLNFHNNITKIKDSFKKHVGSVLVESKKDLLHGSALSKIGCALSFPGKVISGIFSFWNEVVESSPVLQVLDTFVVKPLVLSASAYFLPALSVIKSCEFVGNACLNYSKSETPDIWKLIIDSAGAILGNNVSKSLNVAKSEASKVKAWKDRVAPKNDLNSNTKDSSIGTNI